MYNITPAPKMQFLFAKKINNNDFQSKFFIKTAIYKLEFSLILKYNIKLG